MKWVSRIVAVLVLSLCLPILVLGQAQSALNSEIAPLGKIRIATIGIEVVGATSISLKALLNTREGRQ